MHTQNGGKFFQSIIITDCRNGCHHFLLPVSIPWGEVRATQWDFVTLLFKMWGLVHHLFTLSGSVTCFEPISTAEVKWCHFQTYTSRILFVSAYTLGPLPLTHEQTKPQANNKKDKAEQRWIIPDEFQICETAQPRPVKLTHNWPQTQEQAQSTLKELTSRAQLKCQHMVKTQRNGVCFATNFWDDVLLSNS